LSPKKIKREKKPQSMAPTTADLFDTNIFPTDTISVPDPSFTAADTPFPIFGASYSTPVYDPNFPAEWIIWPDPSEPGFDPSYQCPGRSNIFLTFLIANAAVTVAGIIISCRPVAHFLTCHRLAKKKKKNTIKFNWIIPLAMQILANVVSGAIVHNTPGWHHINTSDVMLLYLLRPRIMLIPLATVTAFIVFKDEYPWMYTLLANAIAESVLQLMAGKF
jgi:hypothetical protein